MNVKWIQVISDLRQLLDLQFDLTNNASAEISPVNLMKRMSNLRQLRDPHTMNRLAQMARQRPPPPPPPPFALPPGRFNNFGRYPPTPSTFMGAPPPPPPNFPQPPKQQDHPNLYLGVDGHLQSPRNNERECPHDDKNFEFTFLFLFQLLRWKFPIFLVWRWLNILLKKNCFLMGGREGGIYMKRRETHTSHLYVRGN